MPGDQDFLKHQHKTYTAMLPKWLYARRLYDGTYCDTEHIEDFLHRRGQGEADGMYADRKKNLDPDLLFANLHGRIAGQFFESESTLTIEWDQEGASGGLGDPAAPTNSVALSTAHQLTNNTDGTGADLGVWQHALFAALLLYEWIYVLVQAPAADYDAVRWQIITPEMVEDWADGDGAFFKIVHATSERDSFMDKPIAVTQYSYYTIGGLYRWTRAEGEDNAVLEVDPTTGGFYEYFADTGSSERATPVVRSYLPFKKHLSYLLAKKAVALLNRESERDNILRIANLPRLVFKGAKKEDFLDAVKKGQNALAIGQEDDIGYTTPPSEPATVAGEVVQDKRDNFFISAYQTYQNEAKDVTATEIRQRERSGRVALLTLLAARFDDIIRQCLFLTEQIVYPGEPSKWGVATAIRTGRFRADDAEAEAERDAEAVFPDGLPLTQEAFEKQLRRQYEARAMMPDDEDVFTEDAARLYRESRMAALIEQGYDVVTAARLAGFEGAEFDMITRLDFAPVGGDGL